MKRSHKAKYDSKHISEAHAYRLQALVCSQDFFYGTNKGWRFEIETSSHCNTGLECLANVYRCKFMFHKQWILWFYAVYDLRVFSLTFCLCPLSAFMEMQNWKCMHVTGASWNLNNFFYHLKNLWWRFDGGFSLIFSLLLQPFRSRAVYFWYDFWCTTRMHNFM